jgi:hypothetical protein
MNTKMNRFGSFLLIGLVLIALSACPGFSRIQDAVLQFSQATHAASTAETAFLNAVQVAECEDQFYTSAYNYSTSKDPKANFDLTGYCKPIVITPEQIETRNALMTAIILYADKMQALATSDDDKQLDANSQTLAQNLNNLASSGGIKLKDPAIVQGVEAAFGAIAKMVLDQVKYSNLRTAAQNMQSHLMAVVKALKSENFGLGQTITGSLGDIEIMLRDEIALSHQQGKVAAADTFFNIMNSRNILMSADALTKKSFASPENAPKPVPVDTSKPVNDALDAIVRCNDAIAKTGTGGIYAAVNDLYKRAMGAKDLYNSIAKK